VIVRAMSVQESRELPDLEWYDALSWTKEDAEYQRQKDENDRRSQRAMNQQGMGA